jgi:hypothetical protein
MEKKESYTTLDSNNYKMTKRLKYTNQILMHKLTSKSHANIQYSSGNMTNSSIEHSQSENH